MLTKNNRTISIYSSFKYISFEWTALTTEIISTNITSAIQCKNPNNNKCIDQHIKAVNGRHLISS